MPDALPDQVMQLLCEWAERHSHIQELWLFGSRAKGSQQADSDIDLGVVLSAGGGALGTYVACVIAGEQELSDIIGHRVDLRSTEPGGPGWPILLTSGRKLWTRSGK